MELPSYSKDIHLHHTYICKDKRKASDESTLGVYQQNKGDSNEDPIYMLQTTEVDGKNYNIFYDAGCREFVLKLSAVHQLGSRAQE